MLTKTGRPGTDSYQEPVAGFSVTAPRPHERRTELPTHHGRVIDVLRAKTDAAASYRQIERALGGFERIAEADEILAEVRPEWVESFKRNPEDWEAYLVYANAKQEADGLMRKVAGDFVSVFAKNFPSPSAFRLNGHAYYVSQGPQHRRSMLYRSTEEQDGGCFVLDPGGMHDLRDLVGFESASPDQYGDFLGDIKAAYETLFEARPDLAPLPERPLRPRLAAQLGEVAVEQYEQLALFDALAGE